VNDKDLRLAAFYLPQFHVIPENDQWWGPGFTEWTNVSRARPLFPGHRQPRRPQELGYYDLRESEIRKAQASLAQSHGIDAFCYYHYWFQGRRLLEQPFNDVLATGEPDFPFFLCWANESWTRAWDGASRTVLMEQTYDADDDRRHFEALLPAFNDPRYVRIDGKPVFLVYRASALPNPHVTTDTWRECAAAAGLPGVYLCRVESFLAEHDDPRALGFDAAVEFQPNWRSLPVGIGERIRRVVHRALPAVEPHPRLRRVPYAEIVTKGLHAQRTDWPRFPCVTPGFDNTARRRRGGVVTTGADPASYGAWLRATLERFEPPSAEENLVFVNAWNEWAEGNYLEPDQDYGRAFLEATLEARRLSGKP
jgi:lipopolysaccharide biosynthesis protein